MGSLNRPIDVIPDEVIAVLKAHDWPGNIRELQNFIERAGCFRPGRCCVCRWTMKQSSESVSRTLADTGRKHILEAGAGQSHSAVGG